MSPRDTAVTFSARPSLHRVSASLPPVASTLTTDAGPESGTPSRTTGRHR